MDDDTFLRELLAILTNPDPAGIDPDDPYGQADDGIDRYDGFGTEVQIETLRLVDGQHGVALEIGFVLDLSLRARFRGLARRGTVVVPFDPEWRQFRGWATPALAAPGVARETWSAAGEHAGTRGRRPGPEPFREMLPARVEQWQLLLAALAAEGRVRQVGPGRIEVDDEHPLTVLITPDEWESALARHGVGNLDWFSEDLLGPRLEDEHYVVVYRDELYCSTREELPPVRGRGLADLDEGGAWYAREP